MKNRSPGEGQLAHPLPGKSTRPEDVVTFENQQIKVQTAHTCIPTALEPTVQAHFTYMSKTGNQDGSPGLRDGVSGHREAVEKEG